MVSRWGTIGVFALCLTLAACQSTGAPSAAPATAGAATATAGATAAPSTAASVAPKSGGSLNVGIGTEPPTLDPFLEVALSSYAVIGQLYDTLIAYDVDLNFVGVLAESWSVAPDGLSVSFALRPNVKFHNGRVMTSEDVKYSIEHHQGSGQVSAGLYKAITSIETPDPQTVVFHIDAPAPTALLAILAVNPSDIVAKEVVEQNGDLKRVDAGTGAFMLDSWQSGSSITLKRFPDYWDTPKPYLEQIVFKIVPDETSAVAALRAGEIDWFQFADVAVATQIQGDSKLTYTEAQSLAYNFLSFNTTDKPFSDVRVRTAVSYALDRTGVLELAIGGHGALTGPIVPAQTAYALPLSSYPSYTTDVEKAKALLSEAGYASGFTSDLEYISTDATMAGVAPVVASQLGNVGITLSLKPLESGIWVDHLSNQTYKNMTVGGSGGYPVPDVPMFNSFTCEGPWNWSGICNPDYDAKILAARAATGEPRIAGFKELQTIVVNDMAPFAYLFVKNQFYGWASAVNGYVTYPMAQVEFSGTWVDR